MGAIFLSYAREDRDCAERLADVIGKAGHDVWWDRRLDGGEEFSDEIVAALDKSDVVLVAWSQESVRSRWVRDEASVGCEKGGLLPVTIDGSQPPMGFRQFHTLDLTGWKGSRRDERTSELLHSIDRRLQGKAGRLTAIPPTVKSKRRPPSLKGRGLWIGVAILLLGLALLGGLLFRNAQFESSKPLRPKFALLTFTTTSTDQAMRELASQSRDSIVHAFSQSGVPLRLMDSVPQGESHSVDFVITGDFSRNGDKVLATVRLDEVAHGATVYTQRFEAGTDDIRDLPERIGAQLAGNLTWAAPMLLLDRRRPLDPALLSSLLQDNFSNEDSLQSYQNAKRVAAEAPDFQSTQMSLAFNTAFVLAELPRSERAEAVAEARRAANRGVALGPGFGDAYAMACLLQSETLRLKCEDRLREAKRIDPDAPFVNTFLSHLLEDVGRFDEATELARLAHSHDIYLPTKIGWMLKAMEFSGQSDDAKDLYLKGSR